MSRVAFALLLSILIFDYCHLSYLFDGSCYSLCTRNKKNSKNLNFNWMDAVNQGHGYFRLLASLNFIFAVQVNYANMNGMKSTSEVKFIYACTIPPWNKLNAFYAPHLSFAQDGRKNGRFDELACH